MTIHRRGSFTSLWARARSLIRGIVHHNEVESEIREEFESHLAMRAEDLQRRGMDSTAAARQARREFGHRDSLRQDAKRSRGLEILDHIRFSWLDVRLGLRMLRRHPLLSLAAIFALGVGIPIGIAPAHVATAIEAPLPNDPQHRIRAIRLWDPAAANIHAAQFRDFEFFSRELRSFATLAAFRTSSYTVGSEDGRAALVPGAEITGAGFTVLPIAPHLGRTLTARDSEAGAPEAAVLGFSLWRSRFAADPNIVGRTIRIGQVARVVVGVMPEGFRFPANEQLWLPMRLDASGTVGPRMMVQVIGRLTDGVSAEQAQAEIATLGPPPNGNALEERDRLRPEVVPFGLLYLGLPRGGLTTLPEYRLVQLLILAVLLVACGNVAMLMFARTVTRFKEMTIRTALGASRSRIVTQVFAETLVLSVIAAGAGVLSVDWIIRHLNLAALAGQSALPYWLSLGVTGKAMLQAVALAGGCATLAGILPAIHIAQRAAPQSVRGRPTPRFGGFTSGLVVADIAVAVAVVGLAVAMVGKTADILKDDRAAGIPAAEFLAVELRLPEDGDAAFTNESRQRFNDHLANTQRRLVAALSREPGVTGVAIADAIPRMDHRARPFDVEGQERSADAGPRWVSVARVDVGFFAALDQPVLSGRDFVAGDTRSDNPVAIVNTAFAEREFTGLDPVGRRIRFHTSDRDPSVWLEIIGVVRHLGVNMINPERGAAVYLPEKEGHLNPMQVAIHAGPSAERLLARLPTLAASVDPSLVMGRPRSLSEVRQGDWHLVMALATGLLVAVGVLVALAGSGLFAMLSLAVSERTREVGIRAALGAPRVAIVMIILRRSLVQIGVGAILGLPFAARFAFELGDRSDGMISPMMAVLSGLGLSAAVVAAVGLLSCVAPIRRVLAIQASEAMRAEG